MCLCSAVPKRALGVFTAMSRGYLYEHPAELAEVEVVGEEGQGSTALLREHPPTEHRRQEADLRGGTHARTH